MGGGSGGLDGGDVVGDELAAGGQLGPAFQRGDDILRRQAFIAGEEFSMADITVIGGLIFAGLVDLPVPQECEALCAWYKRMLERPSVQNRVTMSEPLTIAA